MIVERFSYFCYFCFNKRNQVFIEENPTLKERIEEEKRTRYLERLFCHPNPFIVLGIEVEVKQREARDLEKEKKMSEEIKRRLDTFLKQNTLMTILAFMNQQFHLLKVDEQVDLLNGVASKLGAKDKVVEVKNEKIMLTKEAYQKENIDATMELIAKEISSPNQAAIKTGVQHFNEMWQHLEIKGKVDLLRKLQGEREEGNDKNLKGFSIVLLSISDSSLKNAQIFDEAQKAYREKREHLDPNTQKVLDQKYQIQQQEVEHTREKTKFTF